MDCPETGESNHRAKRLAPPKTSSGQTLADHSVRFSYTLIHTYWRFIEALNVLASNRPLHMKSHLRPLREEPNFNMVSLRCAAPRPMNVCCPQSWQSSSSAPSLYQTGIGARSNWQPNTAHREAFAQSACRRRRCGTGPLGPSAKSFSSVGPPSSDPIQRNAFNRLMNITYNSRDKAARQAHFKASAMANSDETGEDMKNISKIAIGACVLIVGATPALAQMESKPATATVQTEHRSATMTTKKTVDQDSAMTPRHRVVRHKVVHHRHHHTPMHTMKKTSVETKTTVDPR